MSRCWILHRLFVETSLHVIKREHVHRVSKTDTSYRDDKRRLYRNLNVYFLSYELSNRYYDAIKKKKNTFNIVNIAKIVILRHSVLYDVRTKLDRKFFG